MSKSVKITLRRNEPRTLHCKFVISKLTNKINVKVIDVEKSRLVTAGDAITESEAMYLNEIDAYDLTIVE